MANYYLETLMQILIAIVPFSSYVIYEQGFPIGYIYEGHVGIIWRFGRLKEELEHPGLKFYFPLIDRYANIDIKLQTDYIKNIPCGTSNGVIIYFDRIDVVNKLNIDKVYKVIYEYGLDQDKRWIYDKIHAHMNEYCSKHSLHEIYISKFTEINKQLKNKINDDIIKYIGKNAIEIHDVRVTKPNVPNDIQREYSKIEMNITKKLSELEKNKLIKQMTDTKTILDNMEKHKQLELGKIQNQIDQLNTKSVQKLSEIKNEILRDSSKSKSDSEYQRIMKYSDANKILLNKEQLQVKQIESITNKTKIIFGDNIPNNLIINPYDIFKQ